MIRNLIKKWFGLYDIKDLQSGFHCGCCGKWNEYEIVPKLFSWGLCEKCKKINNPIKKRKEINYDY